MSLKKETLQQQHQNDDHQHLVPTVELPKLPIHLKMQQQQQQSQRLSSSTHTLLLLLHRGRKQQKQHEPQQKRQG